VTGSRAIALVGVAVAGFAVAATAGLTAQELALKLRATSVTPASSPMSIELLRWSTDAERAPLLAALTAPVAPPASAPAPPAGRGGRGGGRGAPPQLSPAARLAAAVKTAPTVGFIWGEGPTGFSIKYAWRAPVSGGQRIVLVTDRRLGADTAPPADPAAADADYTVIEARVDARGAGEAKTSLVAKVVVDAAASSLVLDGYEAAPAALKVTR
jgi:hypothetical protein